MRKKTLIWLLAATIMLGARTPVAAIENEEALEMADSKLINSVNRQFAQKYDEPANKARNEKRWEHALSLKKEAYESWKALKTSSRWGLKTQSQEMRSELADSAVIETEAGHYREAAAFYERAADEWDNGLYGKYREPSEKGHIYLIEIAESYKLAHDFVKAKSIYLKLATFRTGPFKDSPDLGLAGVYQYEGDFSKAQEIADSLEKHGIAIKCGYEIRTARLFLANNYHLQNKLAEEATVREKLDDKTCPICSQADEVVPIAYGYVQTASPKEYHRGGCVTSPDSPRWYCNRDRASF